MKDFISADLSEKLSKLFNPKLWVIIGTCILYLDIYSNVAGQVSFEMSLKDAFKFLLSTGLVVMILPVVTWVIHLLVVIIDWTCGFRLSQFYFSFSEDSRDEKDRHMILKTELSKFAIKNNNSVAIAIVDRFQKAEEEKDQLAKMKVYFFLLLTIDLYLGGMFFELLKSLDNSHDLGLIARVLSPFLFVIFNALSYWSRPNNYIEIDPDIKPFIKG